MGALIPHTIANIRGNLQERYRDGYAVLKELIQNADDARADELVVTFVEQLGGLQHPLLQGPLLIIANNKPFTYRNAEAIHYERGGSKGGDSSQIGKFGLGLKSVFHLCEAFFYVSDVQGDTEPVDSSRKVYPRTGIINPWDSKRYDWSEVSQPDIEALRQQSLNLFSVTPSHFFAICLPLRLRRHCQRNESEDPNKFALFRQFFDEEQHCPPDKIFGRKQLLGLMRVMPLLSTVRVLRFQHLDAGGQSHVIGNLENSTEQNADWRSMKVGRATQTGLITFTHEKQTVRQRYCGFHELLNVNELSELANADDWPSEEVLTEDGFESEDAEARQHVGVILLDGVLTRHIRLSDSVFLPLGNLPEETADSLGPICEFLLHGYHFVDSGRNGIDRQEEGQKKETTPQIWNRRLREIGVFPLIIPTLDLYATRIRDEEGANKHLEELTRQLHAHSLVKARLPYVCGQYAWNQRLTADGFQWSKVDKNLPLVELPSFGDDDQLPTQVFPELLSLCVSNNITCSKLPRLSPVANQVPDGFVEGLLSNVNVRDIKRKEAKIQYLADAVTKWKSQFVGKVLRALITVLRKILKELWSPTETQIQALTQLIQVVPDSCLLPISVPMSEDASALLASMLDCEIDAILVPVSLVNRGDRPLATLSTDHAKALLGALVGFRDKSSSAPEDLATVTQAVIDDVLSAWKPSPSETYTRFDEFKLFHGRHGAAVAWYNATEMKLRNDGGRLFHGKESLLKDLTQCLAISEADKLLFLSSDSKDVLCKWIGAIPGCNVHGFVKLLKNKPLLSSDPAARLDCIQAITAAFDLSEDADAMSVLRYLLHGFSAAYASGTSLLVDAGDAWSAMATAILSARKEAWRLISSNLVDFRHNEKSCLKIQDCNADSVSQLLNGLSALDSVDCQAIVYRKDWYKIVLEGWPEKCIEQLKRLTAFPRSNSEELVAITGNTFIEGDVSAAFDVVFPRREFVRDETGILRSRGLVPTVEPKDFVATVLKQANPSTHWKPIMDSLPKMARTNQDGPES